MGNRDHADLLPEESHEIISRLELQLKTQTARASLLQSRLAATQSALDVERIKYAEDLRAEQIAKNKLQQKLFMYYQHVKNVEEEKDELRGAVMEFLQKVEEPNTKWPQSQISISSLLEPVEPRLLRHRNQDISNEFDHDLMNSAASMIESLVRERDIARNAHQLLLVTARAQIANLQAELAHRDYELEKCISLSSNHHSFQRDPRANSEPLPPLDPVTATKVLQLTSSRHKTLEMGNKHLEKRLEEIRRKAQLADQQIKVKDSEGSHQDQEAEVPEDSDITVRMPLTSPKNFADLIAHFDKEIQNLGSAIQAFAAERNQLWKAVSSSTDISSGAGYEKPSPSISQHISSQSSDRVQRFSERLGLEGGYIASLQREKALIEENIKLAGMLRKSHSLNAPSPLLLSSPPLLHTNVEPEPPREFLDIEDGEVSMELATPLLPTTILRSAPSTAPGTPVHANSPIQSSPVFPEWNPFGEVPSSSPRSLSTEEIGYPEVDERAFRIEHQPTDAGFDQLANELLSTEQQVIESEKAISNLANLVGDLERTSFES
ncbi:hypothetical protein BDP27DRAFT_1311527 [Rhodocollybia butyracea]|uniref:Uncharacterized protein n=1 Tax=Rhodocollybia butyracea TaxID=206335 RepID=A0A9P5UGP6_9AGAR|nr:hypothetical protein BDP27DRAFT_1311527 [Rhodocollybia butyracea]